MTGAADVLENVVHNVQHYLTTLNPFNNHHDDPHGTVSRQLNINEIQEHPEYPHVNWVLAPRVKAKLDVAEGRGGPFKISYEIHGHGPKKLIVSAICRLTGLLV